MNTITILGLVAAGFTTVAFVPQAWKTIKTKNTADLSLPTYSLMLIGIALWMTYGIIIEDLPIIVANGVTSLFVGTIFVMKLRHK